MKAGEISECWDYWRNNHRLTFVDALPKDIMQEGSARRKKSQKKSGKSSKGKGKRVLHETGKDTDKDTDKDKDCDSDDTDDLGDPPNNNEQWGTPDKMTLVTPECPCDYSRNSDTREKFIRQTCSESEFQSLCDLLKDAVRTILLYFEKGLMNESM